MKKLLILAGIALGAIAAFAATPFAVEALKLTGTADAGGHTITNVDDVVIGSESLIAKYNAVLTYLGDGLLVDGNLAVNAGTPEKFDTTATAAYRIAGASYTKAATAELTFTAAQTINTAAAEGSFWGAWLVQIDAAGTITTKAVASDQVYATSVAAIAALPAPDAGNIALGQIVIQSNAGASWTANTDDLTAESDCAAVTFADAAVKTMPAAFE